MQLGYTTLGLLLLSMTDCGRVPELPDLFSRDEFNKPFETKLRSLSSAPIIILGRLKSAKAIGAPKRSLGVPEVMVQLTRIRVSVEQVLRGKVSTGPLDFYYYSFSRENPRDLGMPSYSPMLGERCVYFLQECPAGYRSVGDVVNYTLRVRTGYHAQGGCRGKTVGCCIAEVLLVPGEGYSPEALSGYLVEAQFVAGLLCSRSVALRHVERLVHDRHTPLSQEAAEILKAAQADGERW